MFKYIKTMQRKKKSSFTHKIAYLPIYVSISLCAIFLVVLVSQSFSGNNQRATFNTYASASSNTNILQGSFFQPELAQNWDAANFSKEFQYMKNVKMDHAIWQWTVDSTPTKMLTYYPTTMNGFTQSNETDAVRVSLAQAKNSGLQLWLGLNWNDDWWSKGANDSEWLTNEFTISKNVTKELWQQYGNDY
jgi:hypothetical protein